MTELRNCCITAHAVFEKTNLGEQKFMSNPSYTDGAPYLKMSAKTRGHLGASNPDVVGSDDPPDLEQSAPI